MASILTKFLSPKSVLVISFDYEYKGVRYNEYLGRELSCMFVTWADLQFVNGEIAVNDKKLHDFKFVVFGTVGDHGPIYAAALACVKACGVPYFSYGKSEELNSKTLQTVNFKQHSVSHPKTVILTANAEAADGLIKELKLPMVTKIINGSQGKGILKHETKEALVKELKARKGEVLIAQEALTASCDYRIFFIYDDVMYVDKRSATKKGEFRHNVSLGGSLEKVDLPADALAIAKAAQRSMGFDASGVDLLQDEPTGKWYVLEVNSAPQFSEPNKVLEKLVSIIQSKI
jgi:hypothetical protein